MIPSTVTAAATAPGCAHCAHPLSASRALSMTEPRRPARCAAPIGNKEARLGEVEVVVADASMTDAYEGAVPADLVLLCGVFGNISADDIANAVGHLPRLCAPGATVIWTRHRHPPDPTPYIRETFERGGFGELAFEDSPPFGVGANRLIGPPLPFTSGVRLFEFIGYDVLQPDFHASQSRT